MPNIKSAEKRVKVIAAKTANNKAAKSYLKSTIKKAELSLTQGVEESAKTVHAAIVAVDKAASKGVIHKNTAARKKSALAKKLNHAE